MARTSLHRFDAMRWRLVPPEFFYVTANPINCRQNSSFPSAISWRTVDYMKIWAPSRQILAWMKHLGPDCYIKLTNATFEWSELQKEADKEPLLATLIAWSNPRNSWTSPKSIGEGASSLFGGRPGSPENVSCSQTDWNWLELIKTDRNWLKLIKNDRKSIETDWNSTRTWGKTHWNRRKFPERQKLTN